MNKIKKIKPLGSTSPWAWAIEPVHGCNLKCGHCSCRLLEYGKYHFMVKDIWIKIWEIIQNYTPTCRVDLCLAGEPTLHPNLVYFLKIARKISPLSQIQITTNGTKLYKGEITYKDLLEAGANIIYTDMYGVKEKFFKLAKQSKYNYYEYYNKPEKALSPWTYYGPDLKLIVLQEQPDNWPKSRYRAGLLGTWYNHLDWEAARKYGLKKVEEPLNRRCNQPFIYVPVDAYGDYLLCCQDNWHETAGLFGNIKNGIEGFKKYWYSKEMQIIRSRLREKNRKDTSYCSRCCITFSRCDFKHWLDKEVSKYFNGKDWKKTDNNYNKVIDSKLINKGQTKLL